MVTGEEYAHVHPDLAAIATSAPTIPAPIGAPQPPRRPRLTGSECTDAQWGSASVQELAWPTRHLLISTIRAKPVGWLALAPEVVFELPTRLPAYGVGSR